MGLQPTRQLIYTPLYYTFYKALRQLAIEGKIKDKVVKTGEGGWRKCLCLLWMANAVIVIKHLTRFPETKKKKKKEKKVIRSSAQLLIYEESKSILNMVLLLVLISGRELSSKSHFQDTEGHITQQLGQSMVLQQIKKQSSCWSLVSIQKKKS